MTNRTPSIRTLSAVFDNPKEAKRILRMTRKELFAHLNHNDQLYNPLATDYARMILLNSIDPGLFGVESIEFTTPCGTQYAEYLNTGDTYATTLILWDGSYRVQSVGDFVETRERNGCKAR